MYTARFRRQLDAVIAYMQKRYDEWEDAIIQDNKWWRQQWQKISDKIEPLLKQMQRSQPYLTFKIRECLQLAVKGWQQAMTHNYPMSQFEKDINRANFINCNQNFINTACLRELYELIEPILKLLQQRKKKQKIYRKTTYDRLNLGDERRGQRMVFSHNLNEDSSSRRQRAQQGMNNDEQYQSFSEKSSIFRSPLQAHQESFQYNLKKKRQKIFEPSEQSEQVSIKQRCRRNREEQSQSVRSRRYLYKLSKQDQIRSRQSMQRSDDFQSFKSRPFIQWPMQSFASKESNISLSKQKSVNSRHSSFKSIPAFESFKSKQSLKNISIFESFKSRQQSFKNVPIFQSFKSRQQSFKNIPIFQSFKSRQQSFKNVAIQQQNLSEQVSVQEQQAKNPQQMSFHQQQKKNSEQDIGKQSQLKKPLQLEQQQRIQSNSSSSLSSSSSISSSSSESDSESESEDESESVWAESQVYSSSYQSHQSLQISTKNKEISRTINHPSRHQKH